MNPDDLEIQQDTEDGWDCVPPLADDNPPDEYTEDIDALAAALFIDSVAWASA